MDKKNCQFCNCEIENSEHCKECEEQMMKVWEQEKLELEKYWRDTRL